MAIRQALEPICRTKRQSFTAFKNAVTSIRYRKENRLRAFKAVGPIWYRRKNHCWPSASPWNQFCSHERTLFGHQEGPGTSLAKQETINFSLQESRGATLAPKGESVWPSGRPWNQSRNQERTFFGHQEGLGTNCVAKKEPFLAIRKATELI